MAPMFCVHQTFHYNDKTPVRNKGEEFELTVSEVSIHHGGQGMEEQSSSHIS